MKDRFAGILLPISSLPSKYGIGSLGEEAYAFIDNLKKCAFSYWQVLPIGPTSYGDSPYQTLSAFAGNPYFIDLDFLVLEKLLKTEEIIDIDWGDDENVSYEKLWENRYSVLRIAFSRFKKTKKYEAFVLDSEFLEDYALFMAVKKHFSYKPWYLWDDDIKKRDEKAILKYKKLLHDDIEFYKFIQFKFFDEWARLKEYANSLGIKIIGDIPIYISLDSVDIWADPKNYQLDENLMPKFVAGCPPDAFSDYGQKWGNPLYDWEIHEKNDFSWWKKRIKASAKVYDAIRIDHFIGIERYYKIPKDLEPKDGHYESGPSKKLIEAINSACGDTKIIAEDLGVLTDEVKTLLKFSGYPGMKVLEFAFDNDYDNLYLPHNHTKNSILYVGTHDNDTLMGYLLNMQDKSRLLEYLDCTEEEIFDKIIRVAFSSVSNILILQMQDLLKKDGSARMNLPSTDSGNWTWRMKKGEFTKDLCESMEKLATLYARRND